MESGLAGIGPWRTREHEQSSYMFKHIYKNVTSSAVVLPSHFIGQDNCIDCSVVDVSECCADILWRYYIFAILIELIT